MASRPQSKVVRRLPAVHTCSAIALSWMTRSKSGSGIAVGPPLMWNDTSGCILSRWSPVMAPEPGIEEPPVWQVVIRPAAFASATIGT